MTPDSSEIKWFALEITVEPEAAEAIEYALNSLESLGTEINHLRKKDAASVTVIGYFNDLPEDDSIQDELHYALRAYGLGESAIRKVERREVVNEDWLSEWKKHWKPTHVAGFTISPPWEKPVPDGRIVIFIEPNMAFGTGTHETTQLCLTAIDRFYRAGESFLDVGTGTGILSLAAAKMNEAAGMNDVEMYACDTDRDSIIIAVDNAELNGLAGKIDFHMGTITGDTPQFDFVCANLTLDVIRPNLDSILSRAKRVALFSGILADQQEIVIDELRRRGFENVKVEKAGEWISVVVEIESKKI